MIAVAIIMLGLFIFVGIVGVSAYYETPPSIGSRPSIGYDAHKTRQLETEVFGQDWVAVLGAKCDKENCKQCHPPAPPIHTPSPPEIKQEPCNYCNNMATSDINGFITVCNTCSSDWHNRKFNRARQISAQSYTPSGWTAIVQGYTFHLPPSVPRGAKGRLNRTQAPSGLVYAVFEWYDEVTGERKRYLGVGGDRRAMIMPGVSLPSKR